MLASRPDPVQVEKPSCTWTSTWHGARGTWHAEIISTELLGLAREVERESRADPSQRFDGQAATVALHDLPRDREPEPGALVGWLGGEERLEDAVDVLRGDAIA